MSRMEVQNTLHERQWGPRRPRISTHKDPDTSPCVTDLPALGSQNQGPQTPHHPATVCGSVSVEAPVYTNLAVNVQGARGASNSDAHQWSNACTKQYFSQWSIVLP